MGLDMYLYEEEYLSEWSNADRFKQACEALGRDGTDDSISIDYTIGYWRKANAIHNWFVQNVQDGVDECQKSYVSKEDLAALYKDCMTVLEAAETEDGKIHTGTSYTHKGTEEHYEDGQVLTAEAVKVADAVLPATSGFFFGSTDYDEWYLQGIKDTVEILDRIKNDDGTFGRPGMYYYYRSSW